MLTLTHLSTTAVCHELSMLHFYACMTVSEVYCQLQEDEYIVIADLLGDHGHLRLAGFWTVVVKQLQLHGSIGVVDF